MSTFRKSLQGAGFRNLALTEQGMVISQQLAKLDTTDRELVLEVVGKLAARLAR